MSSNGVPLQEISDTVGHKSTHVTETVYRHVIVPAIRGGATVMVTACVVDTGGVEESVALTVKVKVPRALVVPLTIPLLRVRPAGSEPEIIENVYGEAPPATRSG